MAAKKSRTFSTLLIQRSKLGALSKSQNWSAGPWPDQSFCQEISFIQEILLEKHFLHAYHLVFCSSGWIVLI